MLPARTAPRAAVEQVQVYVSYVWVVWQIPEALAKELEEALSGYVWCKNRSHKFLHRKGLTLTLVTLQTCPIVISSNLRAVPKGLIQFLFDRSTPGADRLRTSLTLLYIVVPVLCSALWLTFSCRLLLCSFVDVLVPFCCCAV